MHRPARTTRSSSLAVADLRPTLDKGTDSSVPAAVEKKLRHRMTDLQLQRLETLFKESTHPSREAKQAVGDELGMNLKTVTVWFQNKRQTTRRKTKNLPKAGKSEHDVHNESLLVTEGDGKSRGMRGAKASRLFSVRRPALAAIPQHGSNSQSVGQEMPSKFLVPVRFEVPSASPMKHCAQSNSAGILPYDRWQYIPSSPPSTSSDLSPITPNPSSNISDALDDVFGPLRKNIDGETHSLKRKWDLDWACTRHEKRKRLCGTELPERHADVVADSMGDMANNKSTSTVFQRLHHYGQDSISDPSFQGINMGSTSRPVRADEDTVIHVPHTLVPPEHHLGLSPDLIIGASLLLGFKYSTD